MVQKACKMYSLRQSFIFYARAVRAILHVRSQQQRYHLPTAEDIGGRHITVVQYQRIISLLFVVDPDGMRHMEAAAVRIQAAFRGFRVSGGRGKRETKQFGGRGTKGAGGGRPHQVPGVALRVYARTPLAMCTGEHCQLQIFC